MSVPDPPWVLSVNELEAFRDTFDEQRWMRVNVEQLGIDVRDPLGHQIGEASAKTGPGGPWKPVDGFKHILVGDFDHYGFYNPGFPFSSDEADFNIFITPYPPFAFILREVMEMMSDDDRKQLQRRERGPGFCVECEITPDEHFYSNRYFRTEKPYTSFLRGAPIGVYGPWVRDCGHKGRPEIHPCEVIWWKRVGFLKPRERSIWSILVLQDDSNRFDRESDYDGTPKRPWSKPPRRAEIDVAIQFPRNEVTTYLLYEEYGRNVSFLPDASEQIVTGQFERRRVVRLVKHLDNPERVRARFGSIVPSGSGQVCCILRLEVEIGKDDRGEEGYILLRLEEIPDQVGRRWLEPMLNVMMR